MEENKSLSLSQDINSSAIKDLQEAKELLEEVIDI